MEKRKYPCVTKTDEDYDPFTAGNFHLTPEDKRQYDTLFDKLQPQAGRLSEEEVRNFMMQGDLPDSTLDKIMELSDQDKDGFLDRYEFTMAFQLADRACNGWQIPDQVVISPHKALIIQ